MRRGSVMFIVIWALAIGALVLSSVQLFGMRQAMMGRQALARTQARWAARGGIEWTIAILADHTMEPVGQDAFVMVREMEDYAFGETEANGRVVASWNIGHHTDGRDWIGPMDEHARLNINTSFENQRLLAAFEDMSPDIIDAILDWIDEDEEEHPLGAERNYYLSLSMPYEPRNAPMRSIAELELVAGIWPDHLRGEDWNLNNRLDGNENDSERTWPPDEPDDVMEAKFSGLMTAYSRAGTMTDSGLPRIDLTSTTPEEINERLGFDETLAQALIDYGSTADATFASLLTAQVAANATRGGGNSRTGGRGADNEPEAQAGGGLLLTDDELRLVMAETMIGEPTGGSVGGPGKMNINTAPEDLMLQLLEDREHLVDEILYLRSSRSEGITSLVDLIEIPAFQDDTTSLEFVAGLFDVQSSVYSVTVKGRSHTTELEYEIFAVLDRSTVPIRILEYRE